MSVRLVAGGNTWTEADLEAARSMGRLEGLEPLLADVGLSDVEGGEVDESHYLLRYVDLDEAGTLRDAVEVETVEAGWVPYSRYASDGLTRVGDEANGDTPDAELTEQGTPRTTGFVDAPEAPLALWAAIAAGAAALWWVMSS